MITDKQKEEFVEQMLNEFVINKKFRNALIWLINEMDKTYDKLKEQEDKDFWKNIDKPMKSPKGRLVGRYKLVKVEG